MSAKPDPYGEHLRRVIEELHKLPLCEHRAACKCDRCRRAFAEMTERELEDYERHLHDDPLYVAINSARVCIERFRVRPQNTDLLNTALRELDDAIDLRRLAFDEDRP